MYSDGSKPQNGVGSGLCYMTGDEVLVRENNIFPTELRTIPVACEVLRKHTIFGPTKIPIELIIFGALSIFKKLC